ncbi:3-deoxy-D-manno-octulosonic acid transferase [Tenacibaculum finnmarkense]|uniref:3-deoxy-D-manno-octulosonic acid transferase n=1 Tax=Tenacibaculum finnmarkense genomovar finnmarkense TaxID=1458503 RepID=A0AAP1WFF2_9FLAO|nr:glycosyltransferase N-terminal domain-containing protein [Tenacibaculum finnmarkense]MBE7652034.1 3-deoxy-D-manno-octulosonic acid transferase [Tenacibaculum finnmarkense genomovar finnmarkense]MBE7694251.1 3-deoxy-D-manno-octulosonic acid transferase [Tenacibaculum finnmarkense genomovar finnmarkense]MCD8426251.1 3-deoxy-D-manno-octulosonic acid transferase [Tenacibaculum finnmarkense genomovar finnmarkense]MCG8768990.1 3-deoxy-D-manno-octulosonic acid transferase [Tenacibaculum finnmarkens
MNFIYNLLLFKVSILLRFIALFNKKIKLFVDGRKQTFSKLENIKKTDKVIWFHAASLGEFEQGRPIIEALKERYKNHKIVVTFFSPSGYEIRKNYPLADVVCYLPFDTKSNVQKFIAKIHPEIAIIIKYEFWPNLLSEVKKQGINTILISGIFRKKQSFFKWYGGFMRNKLKAFNHFYVQNEASKKLLSSIGFQNTTIAGDTRFDRVHDILKQDNSLDFINEFKNNSYTVVAGSTWKEDENLFVNYINNHASADEKFIIAPHNINQKQIKELQKSINKKTILYSEKEGQNLSENQVFIIDTIGLLTKIYSYADVAYVGGGLATGLHNILEPATFGVPIVFGANKYKKFQEATDLLKLGSVTIVTNNEDFSSNFTTLKANANLRAKMGSKNYHYIKNNIGATKIIMNYIKNTL